MIYSNNTILFLKKSRWVKRIGYSLIIYLFVVLSHTLWLPWFGSFLVIHTPLKSSDVILVSTGSYVRFRYALELMKENQAEYLLLVGDTRLKVDLVNLTTLQMALDEAIEEGIPKDRIFTEHSTSTRHDARIGRRWLEERNLKTITVVSDKYNMRRLALVFDRVFKNSDFILRYVHQGQTLQGSHEKDLWWRNVPGFIFVCKEWIKFPINYLLMLKNNV